jgi:orotate phosphoribosyltransferase
VTAVSPGGGSGGPSVDSFEAHRLRLLDLLRRLAYEEREVVLASGRRSNFYIDCKQAVLTAEGHFLVGWLVNRVLAERAPDVVAVGGLTMGADPLASAASTLSFLGPRPLNAFYVRKEAKGHGTQRWLEGARSLPEGSPVAILEDVVTTGGSTLQAIERARLHGLVVRQVVAIVDREEGGREAVEREAPLCALVRRSEF